MLSMLYIDSGQSHVSIFVHLGTRQLIRVAFTKMDPYGYQPNGQPMSPHATNYFVPTEVPQQSYPQQPFTPAGYNTGSYRPAPVGQNAPYNPNDATIFGSQFAQNVAMQYGTEALGQGKQMMQQKVIVIIICLNLG